MELGIGIHGEPGRERRKLAPADEVVELLAAAVLDDLPFARGDDVLAFVNGMGGTPLMELYILYGALSRLLDGRGIRIARNLVGLLHDLAGHGRLLDHAAAARRRAHGALGRAGEHAGAAVGRMSGVRRRSGRQRRDDHSQRRASTGCASSRSSRRRTAST